MRKKATYIINMMWLTTFLLLNLLNLSMAAEFENNTLEIINSYRSKHNASSLDWNHTLAVNARSWSDYLAQNSILIHSGIAGENIAFIGGNPTDPVRNAIDSWYLQYQFYNYKIPEFSATTYMFTQLVWAETKSAGAGVSKNSNGYYVVMHFDPAGNVLSNFAENVFPKCVEEPSPPKAFPQVVDDVLGAFSETPIETLPLLLTKRLTRKLVYSR